MDREPPELPPEVSQLLASDPERFSRPISHEEAQFLLYGGAPGGPDCPFPDEASAMAVWFVNRALLMASYWGSGRRPIGWHVIEHAALPWRGRDRERSTLFNAGLLEPAERTELIAEWRRAFDQAEALDPDARQKALVAADVPRSLRRQWERERKRRPAA